MQLIVSTKSLFNSNQKGTSRASFRVKKLKQLSFPNIKGPKFALGRDQLSQFGILGNLSKTPGPGHYSTQSFDDAVKYTMGTRLIDISEKHKAEIPPIGMYEVPGMDKYGYYNTSNWKNSCATLIADPSWVRFKSIQTKNPGPGQYNAAGSMNQKGVYYVGQYKNQLGGAFGPKSIKHGQRLL